MLYVNIMQKLELVAESIEVYDDIEKYEYNKCDCTASCTDNYADCTTMNDNKW